LDGPRPEEGERGGRGVARRGSAACPCRALREQMGQVASSRPWRQKVGTAASVSYLWQLRALRVLTTS
jgi:hypothetical protein